MTDQFRATDRLFWTLSRFAYAELMQHIREESAAAPITGAGEQRRPDMGRPQQASAEARPA